MPRAWLVRDVMTAPVVTIPLDSSLLVAALAMRRDGIRHLAVVEGVRLMGIISERDVNRCAPSLLTNISPDEYNALFENTPVERVMIKSPLTVAPDAPVRDALGMMVEHKLGCLPVVDGDILSGILTRSDLMGLLGRLLEGSTPLTVEE
jgi:CBS domain-containing protein